MCACGSERIGIGLIRPLHVSGGLTGKGKQKRIADDCLTMALSRDLIQSTRALSCCVNEPMPDDVEEGITGDVS